MGHKWLRNIFIYVLILIAVVALFFTFFSGGPSTQERTISESVRLYNRPELAALAEEHSLRVSEFWGDYDGREFANGSPRLILLARK